MLTALLAALIAAAAGEYHSLLIHDEQARSLPDHHRDLSRFHTPPEVNAAIAVNVDIVLARPVFSETRRPLPSEASAHDALPRLTGIVIHNKNKVAIFSLRDAGETVSLIEGSVIGLYVVRSIAADRVTMSGPVGRQVLHPSFTDASAEHSIPDPVDDRRHEPPRLRQVYKGPTLRPS